LRDEQNVLILACDGLWDVVSDEEATKLIADMDSPEQAAITLRNTALSKGSTDNISVVVVFIPPLKNNNNNNNNNNNVPTKSSSGSASKVQAGENINSSGPSSDTSQFSPTVKHRKPHNSNPSVSEKNAPDSTSLENENNGNNNLNNGNRSQSNNSNSTNSNSSGNNNNSNQSQQTQQQTSNTTRTIATQPSNSQIWKTVAPIVVGVSALIVGVASYIVAKKL